MKEKSCVTVKMSFWGQVGLQEGTSVLGVEIQCLYDYGMLMMLFIFSYVSFSLLKMVFSSWHSSEYLESQWLEVVWTILPCFLLLMLGLPSIKLLYLMDELELPEATVKIIGHQWYWSYEYSDVFGSSYSYDSYMKAESSLEVGDYRLLDVDSRCVVATLLHMRGLVTSEDVIHSWAIPSAGIKADAIPGRINQIGLCFLYSGVFYGQCSELCGVNHSFMPICVEAVPVETFTDWIISNHMENFNDNAKSFTYMDYLYWVLKGVKTVGEYTVEILKKLALLYVWWFESVFYYGLYVPAEFAVKSSWSLTKWTFNMCVSFLKWAGWFAISPLDASVYGVKYVFSNICSGVWYVVTKPFEFSYWLTKSIVKGVFSLFKFSVFLVSCVLSSMSSFTDDGFKQVVMERVNLNTFKFLWIISNYYKEHR
uniref:Cytochrome c oxidase subunit 2 n=1 Tax=Unio tumidus TaxID=143298 RepID=A0A1Q1MMN6_9BIVA|nr:cytochrome c oxidase subunit II [Unio tumidus]AQM37811.1 cytochrome c oxidase subunit II [Unio tumidus]AQM37825.1 cytochrome c oxidase subunit II [Unio tumidus]